MKGIVFTEFIEFAEHELGPALIEETIAAQDLPSGGAYTSVGTYDHREMVQLLAALSKAAGTEMSDLLYGFGRYLFSRFVVAYPAFFEGVGSSLDFLERVDSHIHVEVKKLYPDAELPRFECQRPDRDNLILVYSSSRALPDLAEGLIAACGEHFGETLAIMREDLSAGSGRKVRFVISAHA